MKNKIISIFLACFLFLSTCFSSYADIKNEKMLPITMTPQLLSLIASTGVACGLVWNNKEDIINLGRKFYEYYKDDYENIRLSMADSLVLDVGTGLVKVAPYIANIIKDFFDNVFTDDKKGSNIPVTADGWMVSGTVPISVDNPFYIRHPTSDVYLKFYVTKKTYWLLTVTFNVNGFQMGAANPGSFLEEPSSMNLNITPDGTINVEGLSYAPNWKNLFDLYWKSDGIKLPYNGSYSWENSGLKTDSMSLPLSSDLDQLVGVGADALIDGSIDTVDEENKAIIVPNVSNPSISIEGTVSIPVEGVLDDTTGEGTEVEEGVWGKLKDFVVSLVVPSDLFWTSAFEGVYSEFNNSFPMVSLDNFKLLAVGGKPFPNIYVTFFGVKCKIVDGDIINSIVDWLRPLLAGFMMLCLMLFNYRKIYKLIRNTEPFGPIAPGTSDFKTELSAPPMDSGGFSAYDIARDKIRDAMFDIRNEGLSRKNK